MEDALVLEGKNEPVFVLGVDVGGTKTAWGLFDPEGNRLDEGKFATPSEETVFLETMVKLIRRSKAGYVGIGIAGTISANHRDIIVCPNIPELSHIQLASKLKEEIPGLEVTLDNDARVALIGEAWQGSAKEFSSAVMLTLGTGVGGAVMQKRKILPHPHDLSEEVSRIKVDYSDVFPAASGPGTVEALLGGKNLEERFGVSMAELAHDIREPEESQAYKEALEYWDTIHSYFKEVITEVHNTYNCANIIIGGRGFNDLTNYQRDWVAPCALLPAQLGERAGYYGAARLALDLYEEAIDTEWE